jgi:hypothetical protein
MFSKRFPHNNSMRMPCFSHTNHFFSLSYPTIFRHPNKTGELLVSYERARLSECIAIPMNNWGFLTSVYYYLVGLRWQEYIYNSEPNYLTLKGFWCICCGVCNCETSRTSWLIVLRPNLICCIFHITLWHLKQPSVNGHQLKPLTAQCVLAC